MCEDVIRDVVEIFDNPRLFHLGYDEETFVAQRDCRYVVLRQGTMWWHDFLWFVKVTEKSGVVLGCGVTMHGITRRNTLNTCPKVSYRAIGIMTSPSIL